MILSLINLTTEPQKIIKMSKFLHLEITNAGVIIDQTDEIPQNVIDIQKNYKQDQNISSLISAGHQIDNPVRYNTIVNVLTCLLGGIPIPSKQERMERILVDLKPDELAVKLSQNAYIKYDYFYDNESYINTVIGDDKKEYHLIKRKGKNMPWGFEWFHTRKTALDSIRRIKTNLGKLIEKDGINYNSFFDLDTPKTIAGVYDFNMLDRHFGDDRENPIYKRLIQFINEILNVENVFDEYTFNDMVYEIYQRQLNNDSLKEKIKNFIISYQLEWKKWHDFSFKLWMCAIFNHIEKNKEWVFVTSNDVIPKTPNVRNKPTKVYPTYLLIMNGISYIGRFNANIIIELNDDIENEVETKIRENMGWCRCLEGGICEIEILNMCPFPNYKEKFSKIFIENQL